MHQNTWIFIGIWRITSDVINIRFDFIGKKIIKKLTGPFNRFLKGSFSRYLCIACEVLARPLYHLAAISPNIIDIQLVKRGLHDEPTKMRAKLQKKIDLMENLDYEAVLLGFGLCGGGSVGLQARDIPLVIPRVHDCVSLLLGESKRYEVESNKNPGTYWYSQDFAERSAEEGKFTSLGTIADEALAKQFDTFIQQYGRDNAEYLIETLGSWHKKYKRAAFIDMGVVEPDGFKDKMHSEAERHGWRFDLLAGDLLILRDLLNGAWLKKDHQNFIIIPPNHSIETTYDKQIFKCTPG